MFKKLNTTSLLIVLLVLLAVYFVSRHTANQERSFKDVLTDFDQSQVEKVVYTPPEKPAIEIRKKAGSWEVNHEGQAYQTDTARVMNMLNQISNMQTKSIAAKKPDKWNEYEVSDTSGISVEVFGKNNQKLTEFMVGKFSYQQQQQQATGQQPNVDMTSYIRLQSDEVVYGVDGFLKMTFPDDVDQWRDKTLVSVDEQTVNSIRFRGKQEYSLNRNGAKWMINDQPADSAKMQQYLSGIQRFAGQNITEQEPQGEPVMTCEISIENQPATEVEAYASGMQEQEQITYLVKSTQNPELVFSMPENMVQRLFKAKEHFLPGE